MTNYGCLSSWPGSSRASTPILPGLVSVGTLMAGSRLSGFTLVPLERHLKTVEIGWRFGFEQAIKRPAVPQVGADQSGKGERAIDVGCVAWARRSSRNAISATAIWMRAAFSEVPRKRRI